MDIQIDFKADFVPSKNDLAILFCYQINNKSSKNSTSALAAWPTTYAKQFKNIKTSSLFKGNKGDSITFTDKDGIPCFVFGLGEKKSWNKSTDSKEKLRRYLGSCMKKILLTEAKKILIDSHTLLELVSATDLVPMLQEVSELATYKFNEYKTQTKKTGITTKNQKALQLYIKKTKLKPSASKAAESM